MSKLILSLSKPLTFSLLAIFLSGCMSIYPRYQKVKCDELKQPIQTIKRLFADSKHNIQYSEINDKGITLKNGKLEAFSNIKNALIQTKISFFSRKRYFLRVHYKDGSRLMFESKDLELMIESYSVFECLAGIK